MFGQKGTYERGRTRSNSQLERQRREAMNKLRTASGNHMQRQSGNIALDAEGNEKPEKKRSSHGYG